MVDDRRSRAPAEATLGGFVLTRPAAPDAVTLFRHRAAAFAAENGAGADLAGDVSLAVCEATTNAVKYAYGPAGDGSVELSASHQDGWLTFLVSDHGSGFGKGSSDGLGLGLAIIARLSDDLRIVQDGTGTKVLMRFVLPGPQPV